ncbi:MAG: (2Fe-2S) ferredoxin domain-containing protein [Alphaproteobacteria bacterium]|nr:MAG: (2Fe-2S) ferredoxin domain-containing protein [Alphaproteobacteria bacterium]
MTKVEDLDLVPYFDTHVFCCINQRAKGHPRGCCQEKGSVVLRNYLKTRAKEAGLDRVRINAAQCLDRCEYGPVVVIYPEGVWYSCRTKEDMDEILERHLMRGEVVERLLLRPEDVPARAASAS